MATDKLMNEDFDCSFIPFSNKEQSAHADRLRPVMQVEQCTGRVEVQEHRFLRKNNNDDEYVVNTTKQLGPHVV